MFNKMLKNRLFRLTSRVNRHEAKLNDLSLCGHCYTAVSREFFKEHLETCVGALRQEADEVVARMANEAIKNDDKEQDSALDALVNAVFGGLFSQFAPTEKSEPQPCKHCGKVHGSWVTGSDNS